jgi:hypothetical protein
MARLFSSPPKKRIDPVDIERSEIHETNASRAGFEEYVPDCKKQQQGCMPIPKP